MPPVGFWASSSSSYDSVGGTATFLTPAAARENDVLIVVLASPSSSSFGMPDGWVQLATFSNGTVGLQINMARRVVTSTEPAQHAFTVGAALNPDALGLMLLYRGTNPLAGIVDGIAAAVTPAATAFVAPSVTLTTYSDLVLLAYYAKDAAGTATFVLPAGTTQRGPLQHGGGGHGGTLIVAELLKEATGATGTQTATCNANQVGLASSYAIQAAATLPAAAAVPDVPGAIGLPKDGI